MREVFGRRADHAPGQTTPRLVGSKNAAAFAVYASWSAVTGLQPTAAGDSPGVFMLSVFVQKLGHSLTFVLMFYVAREYFRRRWLTYAALWWLFSVFGEFGEAIAPTYSWEEAAAGIIAEAVYFRLAALTTKRLVGLKDAAASTAATHD